MTKCLGVLRELAERSLFLSVPQACPVVHRKLKTGLEGRRCLSVCMGLMGVKGGFESAWGRAGEGMGMHWLRRAGGLVRMSRGVLRHVAPCCAPLRSPIFRSEAGPHANVNFTKRTQLVKFTNDSGKVIYEIFLLFWMRKRTQNQANRTQQQGAEQLLTGKTARCGFGIRGGSASRCNGSFKGDSDRFAPLQTSSRRETSREARMRIGESQRY